jgi:hypothetical protein
MGSIPGGDENFLSEHPQKYKKMFEGRVNLLPILKDLAHTSPNVEFLKNKKKII